MKTGQTPDYTTPSICLDSKTHLGDAVRPIDSARDKRGYWR